MKTADTEMHSGYAANLAANFLGSAWIAGLNLAAIPFYIYFVGIEFFGLIGFFTTLLATSRVADLGLSSTANRELARYSVQPGKEAEARDFVRTVEVCYWTIAIVLGTIIWLLSSLIARQWLNAKGLPEEDIVDSVVLMGMAIALQLPVSLYHGGLMGLQRQVTANLIRTVMITVSVGGGVLVLYLVGPSIIVFFLWQVAASTLHVGVAAVALWKNLPGSHSTARVTYSHIRRNLRFAIGMGGIGISALVLSQIDRLVLSKLLSLEVFGYYVLGYTLGSALSVIVAPVFNATLPRFSALLVDGNDKNIKNFYRLGVELMAVLVLPVAGVIFVFSEPLLNIWTSNLEAALNAGPIASLIVVGTALNGLAHIPYALQIAHGWTRFGLCMNLLLILAVVPSLVFAVDRYGVQGAATAWLGLNAVYILVSAPVTHHVLLRGETLRWLFNGLLIPAIITALMLVLASSVAHSRFGAVEMAIFCLALVFIGTLLTATCAREVRRWLIDYIRMRFSDRGAVAS